MKTTRRLLLFFILILTTMPSFSGKHPELIGLDCGNGVSLELFRIPAGTFMMGSPKSELDRRSDEIQHRVTISKMFFMGIHEVTQAEYEAVTGENPSYFKDRDLPVENVSWYDATEFCRRLSEKTGRKVRLPTEAEWEYACRAGTTTPFHFGETLPGRVNFNGGDGSWRTKKVGYSPANDWLLRDMHGNVQEWCSDLYGEYPEDDVADPKGVSNDTNRVARGGSWDYLPEYCRSACRSKVDPHSRNSYQGFRVCLDPESGIDLTDMTKNDQMPRSVSVHPPRSSDILTATLSREPAKHPLLHYERMDMFDCLRAKGIVSAEYNYYGDRILVSREDEKKAILALAEENLLEEKDRNERHLFRVMLLRWAFPDSDDGKHSAEFIEQAYVGEMARLIECMDDIAKAHVKYFEDARKTLFGIPHKAVAIIWVETRHQKPLSEKTVNAIASIVATDPRLDRRDVVVIDQMGNKFRPDPFGNSLMTQGRRRRKAEFALDEQLRPMIEKIVRTWYEIPSGYDQYCKFDVNVFPTHTLDFSIEDAFIERMVLKYKRWRPPEDTGDPSFLRYRQIKAEKIFWTEGFIEKHYFDGKEITTLPGFKDLPEPSVKDLTIAVVIHLPGRIKRDEGGMTIRRINGCGDALELESIEPLSHDRIEMLSRQILQASNMALVDSHEKLRIVQESWSESVCLPQCGGPPAVTDSCLDENTDRHVVE